MSHRSAYRFLWQRQRLPKENIRAVKNTRISDSCLTQRIMHGMGRPDRNRERDLFRQSQPYFTSGLMKTREPRSAPPGPAMRSRLQRISPDPKLSMNYLGARLMASDDPKLNSRGSWHGAFQVLSWCKWYTAMAVLGLLTGSQPLSLSP